MRLDRPYGKVKNFTVIFDLIDNISKLADKKSRIKKNRINE